MHPLFLPYLEYITAFLLTQVYAHSRGADADDDDDATPLRVPKISHLSTKRFS